tara:strand:- start:4098 stop:5057 length:960 start_codon:yes stop_codon:yes gene_type:complete
MRKLFIYIIILSFFSCEKEEIPISPHSPGNIQTNQIELGTDYRFQTFYDLGSNSIVSNNLKTEWDLGFESGIDGYHIILNSSTYSSLAYVDNVSFYDTISTSNLTWNWDNPDGNLDSTAFGDYRNKNGFFVYDRGFDLNGNSRGYKKILIDSINEFLYQIIYSNLDNSEPNSFNINKDNSVEFTCFSFDLNTVENIQPPSNDWDLLFTQYTHLYSDTTTPAYLVTGVVLNSEVLVAEDNSFSFEEINYSTINQLNFTYNKDAIGFDWKEYNFDAGFYTVNSNLNYIIKDRQQRYFKLRFTDFYNSNGDKGCPTFEIQEL